MSQTRKMLTYLCWSSFLFIILMCALTARRAQTGSNDFDTFYNAGYAVFNNEVGIYYDGPYYERGQNVSPFLYSPFAAIFFSLLAVFPISVAAILWCLLNFFFIYMIYRSLRFLFDGLERMSLKAFKKKENRLFEFIVVVFLSAIVIDNFAMAQINITVFTFCLLGLCQYLKNRKIFSGVLFAIAILLKLTPALFLIYFLCKKQWKVLFGILIGLLFFTAVLPTSIFGIDKNRILHQQWLGRTIKPLYVVLKSKFIKEEAHPQKKSAKIIEHDQLASQLTSKNQSLSAALTRVLLRERNERAHHPELPIYAAQEYSKLPVLFGGFKEDTLKLLIRFLQLVILFVLLFIWLPRNKNGKSVDNAEVALLFLSLTLLAPWARSHQAISWIFMLAWTTALINHDNPKLATSFLKKGIYFAFLLYALQALPYGKAAGLGAWSNLVLWVSVVAFIFRNSVFLEKKEKRLN